MVLINNRDRIKWQKDMSVQDVLKKMHYSYSLITVTVNGELVPQEEYEEYLVPDNAQITVFHLAHGG